MRIAVACFSPYLGGMELDSLKYAALFSSVHPTFFLFKKNSLLEKELHTSSKAESLSKVRKIGFNFNSNWSPWFIYDLRKKIIKNQIDVIVFFGASELKALAPAIIGLKVKIVMRHGTTKADSKKDWFHKLLYESVEAHVPISQHLASNVSKIFPLKEGQIPKMIYNFVDLDDKKIEESCAEKSNYIKNDNAILEILHVGRITEGKGQLEAIKAVHSLKQKNISFKFTIVGSVDDESYYQALKHYIRENNLQGEIVFAGYHQDMFPFYKSSHILLFPSYGEGLPNAVLEALGFGLVVLAFENTIFPELRLLGLNVHLASDRDQYALNLKLESISLSIKELLAKSMQNNPELLKKYFSTKVVLNQWIQLLKKVITQNLKLS